MCLAVPGKILSIDEHGPLSRAGRVDFGGVAREINLALVPDATEGDYVLVHVGVAISQDGIAWKRLSDQPFLANGKPGAWNSAESGHPDVFVDADQRTHLFFQGNNDRGKTWWLARVRIGWDNDRPYLLP